MIRFYFIGFLVIFIMIPKNAHSILLEPVLNIIDATGNLTCYSDSTVDTGDYQLCAIRVYNYFIDADVTGTVSIQDGMWFTNTFRQLIKTRNCTGFEDTSDIGSGTCDLMPYEIASRMTLCICATSGCNLGLKTCEESISTNQDVSLLPTIMPDLTKIIECANISDSNFTCFPIPKSTSFINAMACENYVETHSVLCTIITDSLGAMIQGAFIEENYQSYLTDRLHDLKLLRQQIPTATPDQTDTSIYVTYSIGTIMNEECGCTQNSFCNYNISTCFSNSIQTETTTPTEVSSTSITAEFPSTSITTEVSSTSITTEFSSTSITTEFSSTSITTEFSSTSITTESMISVTTAIDTATAISLTTDSSIINVIVTDSSITADTAADFTTENTTESITNTFTTTVPSSDVENSVPNGTGLSAGAIAGIVIGAVVGILLIVSLILLIFIRSGQVHWPSDRSNDYQI